MPYEAIGEGPNSDKMCPSYPRGNKIKVIQPQDYYHQMKKPHLLFHVGDPSNFSQAHLPNAILIQPAELIDGSLPAIGNLPSKERLNQLLNRVGFAHEEKIFIYDEEGGGWAGRLGWTLDIIGKEDWVYIDGGIHSWHEMGFPLEAGIQSPRKQAGNITRLNMTPVAQKNDVLAAIEDQNEIIWDVRSKEEYQGLRSGSSRFGHIPGAINIDWLELKDKERSQRLRNNIEDFLRGRGITGEKPIITHCQTHHRSGLSYLVGRMLGFKIRAYAGSWAEWGNDDDTPIEISRG